ncbi:MAG: type IV pilus secretin PilQ [Limnobacter sp.]|nr:type IV pilus secretin PilQ [Limnobacter sp.]
MNAHTSIPHSLSQLSLLVGLAFATLTASAPAYALQVVGTQIVQDGPVTQMTLEFDETVTGGVLVFRSGSPLKQVIDLPVALDQTKLDMPNDPSGLIKKAAVMSGDGRSRILLDLNREMDLKHEMRGKQLVLRMQVAGTKAATNQPPGGSTVAAASAKPSVIKASSISVSTPQAAKTATQQEPNKMVLAVPVATSPLAVASVTNAVTDVVPEVVAVLPEVSIKVRDMDDRAELSFVWKEGRSGALKPIDTHRLKSPERQVVDVPGQLNQEDVMREIAKSKRFAGVEVFPERDYTRLVFRLAQAYDIEKKALSKGEVLVVRGPVPFKTDSMTLASMNESGQMVTLAPQGMPVKKSAQLTRWHAGLDDTGAELLNLEFDRADLAADSSVRGDTLRVRVQHAEIPDTLSNKLAQLKGKGFKSARIESGTQGLTVVVQLNKSRHQIRQEGSLLQISLRPEQANWGEGTPVAAMQVAANAQGSTNSKALKAKPVAKGAGEDAVLGSASHYRGKPISLNFKDTDVRTVMQVFAEFTDMNLVLSDSVKGKVTVFLDAVPWDQALEIVLKSKNLIARKSGNVLLVSPQEELAAATAQAQVAQSSDDLDPLIQRSFQVSYQKTTYLQDMIGKKESRLLSSRGSVISDERTSQIFVEDTPRRLEKIGALIQQMDKPVKQVMIEAKVVLADTRVSKEISASIRAATLAGERLQSVPEQLGREGFVDTEPGSAVNGAYTLLTSGGTRFVNIQLRALESNNRIKTVSNPRVITSNKEPAVIEQGTEIPYRVATSSGATSIEFREASLKLEVTPQIAPDGTVILDVDVSKDSVGQQTSDGLAIDTRHVKTKVAVSDGGTVVLGGIIERGSNNTLSKIPLLGDIPYLGNLFKSRVESEADAELLIFLTPVVLKDQ